ncbi:MAG: hypothetical protein ACOYT8_00120 [Candidatus Dependentiae bacterium]
MLPLIPLLITLLCVTTGIVNQSSAHYSFDITAYSHPIKLHLGCGQIKFDGYINIDYPQSEQTVQKQIAADIHADISHLNLPANSIKEIRSHHMFEHFSRSVALALLCNWHTWLENDGDLIIETPDFERSMHILMNDSYSYVQKQSTLRHIFGSHEAHWAVHWDGWYAQKFKHVLSAVGFEDISFEYTQWQLCPNIIVRAKKKKDMAGQVLAAQAKELLRESLVDATEQEMLRCWCDEFDRYFKN